MRKRENSSKIIKVTFVEGKDSVAKIGRQITKEGTDVTTKITKVYEVLQTRPAAKHPSPAKSLEKTAKKCEILRKK